MSTRSHICKVINENELYHVYCHFDGYFSGVGADLVEKANSEAAVNKLFEFGSMDTVEEALTSYGPSDHLVRGPVDIKPYLNNIKEDCTVEFLYVWIPFELAIREDWIADNFVNFYNYTRLPRNAKANGGVWIACSNSVRIWSFAEVFAEGQKRFEAKKIGKFIDEFEIWRDKELKKSFIYSFMLDGVQEAKKLLNEEQQVAYEKFLESKTEEKVDWQDTKSQLAEKKDTRDVEDYKNMVDGLHEIADKIKSADYLPKTLEAYDAYISALSYMVNKLKEDKQRFTLEMF